MMVDWRISRTAKFWSPPVNYARRAELLDARADICRNDGPPGSILRRLILQRNRSVHLRAAFG